MGDTQTCRGVLGAEIWKKDLGWCSPGEGEESGSLVLSDEKKVQGQRVWMTA